MRLTEPGRARYRRCSRSRRRLRGLPSGRPTARVAAHPAASMSTGRVTTGRVATGRVATVTAGTVSSAMAATRAFGECGTGDRHRTCERGEKAPSPSLHPEPRSRVYTLRSSLRQSCTEDDAFLMT